MSYLGYMKNSEIKSMYKINKIVRPHSVVLLFPLLWGLSINFSYEKAILHWAYVAGLFCVIGLIIPKSNLKASLSNPIFILTTLFTIYASICYFTIGFSSSLIRASLSALLIMLFTPKDILIQHRRTLFVCTIICAVIAICFSSYQSYILDLSRSHWRINPIPYTTFSCCIAIIAFYWSFHIKGKMCSLLLVVSCSVSLASLYVAQTRGVWLAFSGGILVSILILFLKDRTIRLSLLFTHLVLFGATTLLFHGKVEQRIEQTRVEATKIQEENYHTSFGSRLQMWDAGLKIIQQEGVWGVGDRHSEIKRKMYLDGKLSKSVVSWTHYHNIFIDSLVRYGFLGSCLS
ncbi:O-antigen ligase [Vibrio astriarenae]|nr:O-antigen ligase [Vibrio sp. C7]